MRYIYANALPRPRGLWSRLFRPGRILLKDVHFRPGGMPITKAGGLEEYNATAKSRIPNLILNATSLNSGQPFRFSSMEIGDGRLGYFRIDETEQLLKRKNLLEQHDIRDRRWLGNCDMAGNNNNTAVKIVNLPI